MAHCGVVQDIDPTVTFAPAGLVEICRVTARPPTIHHMAALPIAMPAAMAATAIGRFHKGAASAGAVVAPGTCANSVRRRLAALFTACAACLNCLSPG